FGTRSVPNRLPNRRFRAPRRTQNRRLYADRLRRRARARLVLLPRARRRERSVNVQLALDFGRVETMITRVPTVRARSGKDIYEWKRLQDAGWSVTALLAPDRSVVLLACRGPA